MKSATSTDLEYKPDAAAACERMAAWWEKEIIDRPAIQVTAPRPRQITPPAKHHASLRARWMDVDYVLDCAEARIASTYWGAEQLPQFWPNLGPDVMAAACGAELLFGEDTSWSVPLIRDWADAEKVRFNADNRYVQTILSM